MSKTTLAFLFSWLSLTGLLAMSCGAPDRRFTKEVAGAGGDIASSGRTATAGRGGTGAAGTKPSAGSGAVSVGGGVSADGGVSAGGGEENGGSGASSGGDGMPECDTGQKRCGGACVQIDDPAYGCDPTLCTTTGCPAAQGGTLVCEAGKCLLGSCGAETKKCDGRCVSRTDPAYGCGATTCDAGTCPSQSTGATLACEGSTCVIGSCPATYKKCGNKCVAISDPTYGCGATTCDATSCPNPGTGTLVCQNSVCVTGTCGAGTKKCGSNCVTIDANSGCADPSRCTACASNEACSGTPTTCQCAPTPMATACNGKCGSVSNGCGGTYTCGTCNLPQSCGGGGTPNVCGGCTKTQMSTACSGKNCGTVSDGCGGTYTCGTCNLPQSCGGGGTANVCGGCTKTQMSTACSGKSCGTASDGCGGTYTCGTCSSSSPICVSNACKQCGSISDCPSGTFNCTNNVCMCRTPNSGNIIKDGGFDSQSTLNSWTSSGTVWTNGDADGCPGSGSLTISSSISRCFQISKVPAGGTLYALGIQYKTGSGGNGGCIGSYYQDSLCKQGSGPDFLNLGAEESSTWTTVSTTNIVSEGTSSILVQCQSYSSSLSVDQIFLRLSGFTGSGF